jgi:hypothetical protein
MTDLGLLDHIRKLLLRNKCQCDDMLKASKESRAALQRVLHLGQASGKPGEIYYP